jgi:UDPglucose--hexose-1-phosphate uridylyltransferase
MSELRWHPLLRQWVVISAHRQDRPQMPEDGCPFCPGSGRVPEFYDVHLYPNDFPAFEGTCDVVLYSPQHHLLPSQLPVSQWEKVIALWRRRSVELAADRQVKHVMIFENQGEPVGVTMPHPHGQIYGFPFVPLRAERESEAEPCAHCKVVEDELLDGRRVLLENRDFVLFVPFFSRFPYETQIYARRHVASLAGLSSAESKSLAKVISLIRRKYDALFGSPMPLMMAVHQDAHFYIEFLPLQRSATKLKYLAAVESASWTFLNDVVPEEAAIRLRTCEVSPATWPEP